MLKELMIRSTFIAFVYSVSFAAHAMADTPKQVDVPAGSLIPALEALARQEAVELLYQPEQLRSFYTRGVKGSYTPQDAVRLLLKGTPLELRTDPSGAMVIAAPDARTLSRSAGAEGTQEGKNNSSDGFLLAQETPGQPQGDVSVEKKGEEKKKAEELLQVVVVTGSRIPTVAGNEVQPVRSYTRQDIENSGQITMGEFLNTLPDVSTFSNSTFQLGYVGAQAVQFHGLPVGTTLTLLDGQRLETNISGFFDLSNIPLAAVERIEILPVGASAIYGADGLGGAVNTILRKNFDGFEANATLDTAPGVNDPGANLAWGKSGERGSISIIGSYQGTGELLGAQREPWSMTTFPSNFPASLLAFETQCAPGNVYSVDGSNLPGLNSSQAAIPAGITGVPTPSQFAPTAGKQNYCSGSRFTDITPQSQREGAILSGHYELAESADLFTEILLSHKTLQYQTSAQIQVIQGMLAANNPYNPFGEAVNVSFAYPGAGTVEDETTTFIRPTVGARGSVFSGWHYETTVSLSQDRLHDHQLSSDPLLISNALASSDPATALNPFASGAPGTPALLNSLINPAVDAYDFSYNDRLLIGQGILRGPLLQLPSGALQVVLGSEVSQEKQDTLSVYSPPSLLHRNTYAAFSEARIPLLRGGESSQGAERLALTLAGRYDHSNDYGGKATWQGGLLWRATETISFRGGYGQSYQAPQLSQISGPQTVLNEIPGFGLPLPDPFRGNQPIDYPVRLVSGPNYNLKPETGDSFSLGLEYSSQAVPGLHTSLTWYDLNITNYIATEAIGNLLGYPNLFPSAVVRAPPSAEDQAQGYLGAITQINNVDYNFGAIHIAGFDVDIRYLIDTPVGQFTPSLAIANIYKWQSALLPNAPEINAVSTAENSLLGGGVGWSPRWKGTASLAWKKGPISTNLQGRYIGRYLDDQEFVPNTHEIGNTWVFDFNARYELGKALAGTNAWLANSYISFGVVNLFNKTPPIAYTPYLYDIQEYDIRGRLFHFSAGMRF